MFESSKDELLKKFPKAKFSIEEWQEENDVGIYCWTELKDPETNKKGIITHFLSCKQNYFVDVSWIENLPDSNSKKKISEKIYKNSIGVFNSIQIPIK